MHAVSTNQIAYTLYFNDKVLKKLRKIYIGIISPCFDSLYGESN